MLWKDHDSQHDNDQIKKLGKGVVDVTPDIVTVRRGDRGGHSILEHGQAKSTEHMFKDPAEGGEYNHR
jgi:hypothetical protein